MNYSTLQHSSDESALLFTFSSRKRLEVNCLSFQKFPPQGLATLPRVCFSSFPSSQEAYLSFQRSWAYPFKAFLLPTDRSSVSPASFRSCAFPENPTAFSRRFIGLIPVGKPSPNVLPDDLNQGGGSCFLGPHDLSGSLSQFNHQPASFPRSVSLPPVRLPSSRELDSPQAQGFQSNQAQHLPIARTLACLAFLSAITRHLFKEPRTRGLFFPLKHAGDLTISFGCYLCESFSLS